MHDTKVQSIVVTNIYEWKIMYIGFVYFIIGSWSICQVVIIASLNCTYKLGTKIE